MAHVPQTSVSDTVKKFAPDPSQKWTGWVAVSTAVFAALAAVSSLLSGYHTDEAMIEQIKTADQWSFYQAKGIKSAVLESKLELLPALGKTPAEEDVKKAAGYKKEQESIMSEARGHEARADDHRHRRAVIARAVSAFQIAIALCAIALLTKKRWFWALALLAGAGGMVFGVLGAL